MYGKIFRQIFASSIAQDYHVRHMFMDMIVLADSDGVVDMTHESISGQTGLPVEQVRQLIAILEKPDPQSRTRDYQGARLVKMDEHRNWGWRVVNYCKYRAIATEEQRRETVRKRVARHRAKGASKTPSEVLGNESCNAGVTGQVLHSVTAMHIPITSSSAYPGKGVQGETPTLEAVLLACAKAGIASSDGEWFWNHCEGNGWTNNGHPIKSWPRTLAAWKAAGYLPSQKGLNGTSKRTRENPRNAGIAGDIDEQSKAIAAHVARQQREHEAARLALAAKMAGNGGDSSSDSDPGF